MSNVIWRPLGFLTAPHHLISWSAQRKGMWQAGHKQPYPPLSPPSTRAATVVKVCYLFRSFHFNSKLHFDPNMHTHIHIYIHIQNPSLCWFIFIITAKLLMHTLRIEVLVRCRFLTKRMLSTCLAMACRLASLFI